MKSEEKFIQAVWSKVDEIENKEKTSTVVINKIKNIFENKLNLYVFLFIFVTLSLQINIYLGGLICLITAYFIDMKLPKGENNYV